MVADQLIGPRPGTQRRVGGVGHLRYVVSPDHQHWHLLGFDRYELRRAGGRHALVRDRKSGFCLGDRYAVTTRPVPGAAAQPTYTGRCGLRQPGRRQVREGISVGYGDFYAAHLEYQDLPLDGLRDGRYVLVHRVNAGRSCASPTTATTPRRCCSTCAGEGGGRSSRWSGRVRTRTVATARSRSRPSPVGSRSRGTSRSCRAAAVPWSPSAPGRVRLLAPTADCSRARRSHLGRDCGRGRPARTGDRPGLQRHQRRAYVYFTAPTPSCRLERWRWTVPGLVPQVSLIDAISSRRRTRLGADRVRTGPTALRCQSRRRPSPPGAGSDVAQRQVPRPDARPVSRRRTRSPSSRRDGLRNTAGLRLATRHQRCWSDRPRPVRL